MSFFCLNGEMIDDSKAILNAKNRSFRYGDGLFETIKVLYNEIVLKQYHFERLFFGMSVLKMDSKKIVQDEISSMIMELCKLNNCLHCGRVRIAVFREDNNNNDASYIIEAMPLQQSVNKLNDNGWAIDIFPDARKSCDVFANLKSANYLPYVMADLFSKEKGLDECLVLNTENNICDASKANVFLVFKGDVYTPALHQGCVNGVKRRFVIDELKKRRIRVHQKDINEQLLLSSDEVFLTNAINDMRWVQSYRQKQYVNSFTRAFYHEVFSTI